MNKFNLKLFLNPYFLLIFSALIFSTLTDQYLSHRIEAVVSSKDGLSNMIWFWGALSILSAILFPLLISILCAYTLVTPVKEIPEFFSENLELSLIETLRAWGKTFLWAFVFLLPAVWKYINYFMTPFVVMFSKEYKAGRVDALEYSTKISKNFFWSLKMWMGVFYLLVPVAMYFLFDTYSEFKTHPFLATGVVLIHAFFTLLFHFIILRLFVKFLNEVENGAHV